VTFQDGTHGIADFPGIMNARECGIYQALKDVVLFEQARLEFGIVT